MMTERTISVDTHGPIIGDLAGVVLSDHSRVLERSLALNDHLQSPDGRPQTVRERPGSEDLDHVELEVFL